jgi:hypothetical protein
MRSFHLQFLIYAIENWTFLSSHLQSSLVIVLYKLVTYEEEIFSNATITWKFFIGTQIISYDKTPVGSKNFEAIIEMREACICLQRELE